MSNYIENELKKVSTYSEYKPKIKIINIPHQTKWLDITEKQLIKIKEILLKK